VILLEIWDVKDTCFRDLVKLLGKFAQLKPEHHLSACAELLKSRENAFDSSDSTSVGDRYFGTDGCGRPPVASISPVSIDGGEWTNVNIMSLAVQCVSSAPCGS
jgi:hypothetical protein